MIKKFGIVTVFCFLTFPLLTFAGKWGPYYESRLPAAGLFIGLGGSYNSINLDQNVNLLGVSDVSNGGTEESDVIASGEAQGPIVPFHNIQSTFAPVGQVGFFSRFINCYLIWGIKLSYLYLGSTTFSDSDLSAPQVGILTPTDDEEGSGTTFTGHATIESAQTQITREIILTPFIGHSFKNSFIYLGVGPALIKTQSNFYNVTGFADVNGVHYDVTGTPSNFSSARWMMGAAAQIGLAYFFDCGWSLDFNYTYAKTREYTTNYVGSFTSLSGGFTTFGTLFGSSKQRLTEQNFAITINKVFA